ncbi:helix-turn-helix domain-containing protein [Sutcliffiella halmapala]|uniref:helix-turn-helix domain-containing protein n=1 Tax=Sutcliffiella halmapala TaxID=79882 RepID=UPI001116C6D8|nr:helix-turn-helix transcriptional regulator [Sutcliffiella halmapala]
MEKLGDLIKNLRGKESLRDASKKIGISHTYLDTIEKGFDKRSGKPVKPTPETLELISNAYSYPYDELMKNAGYLKEDITLYKVTDKVLLSPEDLKVLDEIKKHPVLFHELANAPEKKIKQLIKMWEVIKMDMNEDDEHNDIIED